MAGSPPRRPRPGRALASPAAAATAAACVAGHRDSDCDQCDSRTLVQVACMRPRPGLSHGGTPSLKSAESDRAAGHGDSGSTTQ